MNALDYYDNPDIRSAIAKNAKYISNTEDREDFQQEIFAELYDTMPLDTEDALRLINRVFTRFKRSVKRIYDNETELPDNI